jgi:hypothetical protein
MPSVSKFLAVSSLCCGATAVADDDHVNLATFDGAKGTSFGWKGDHYPAMGDYSNMTVLPEWSEKHLRLAGFVGSQKPLRAGFCNVQTHSAPFATNHFNDASKFTHLKIRARSSVAYPAYKVSFNADKTLTSAKTYKASFALPGDGEWHTVSVPFSDFTNTADTFTGDCTTVPPSGHKPNCCSEATPHSCPSLKSLQGITQLGIWLQGVNVDGKFDFELESISAGSAGADDKPAASWWPPKSAIAEQMLVV